MEAIRGSNANTLLAVIVKTRADTLATRASGCWTRAGQGAEEGTGEQGAARVREAFL